MNKFGNVNPPRIYYVTDLLAIPVPELSVVIPTGGVAHKEREKILAFNLERYRAVFPEFEIITSPNFDALYNKSKAVNSGVEMASNDLLLLADSDVFFTRDLVCALYSRMAKGSSRSVWGSSRCITENSAKEILKGQVLFVDREVEVYFNGGANGLMMITRDVFNAVNGMDENFEGWGCEDVAFTEALDALGYLTTSQSTSHFHLYHGTKDQSNYDKNGLRYEQYELNKDPQAMLKLVSKNRNKVSIVTDVWGEE